MNRFFLLIFCFAYFFAASQIGPRSWQDHLSLNNCNSITKFNGKIYASNYNGIIKITEEDFSIERLNKINGLSDVGVQLLRTNPYNNKLIVVYANCNIDVINTNGQIKNYSDIKSKTLNGKKTINEVTFKDQFAYLACGFGIIVFDTEKLEVKETYIIGPNGTNLEIYQIALNDSLIFAATPNGLYKSNYKTKILNNFNDWTIVPTIPSGPVGGVVSVAGKMIASYSPWKTNALMTQQDTLYVLINNTWSRSGAPDTSLTVKKLTHVDNTQFSLIDDFGVLVLDVNTFANKGYFTAVNNEPAYAPQDAYFDKSSGSYSFWIADRFNGAFQTYGSNPYYPQNVVKANGTNSNLISNIDVYDGRVAVSPSAPDQGGGTGNVVEGVNIFDDNTWSYIKPLDFLGNGIHDIDFVYFDRKDKSRFYASSWFQGLLEYKNNQLVAVYDHTNTPVLPEVYPGAQRASGMCMDDNGNLWFANSDSKNFLSVKKTDGTFQNFTFDAGRFTRKVFVDKNNYIWCLHERQGGITVFNHNNFSYPIQNVNYKILTKDVGTGNLGGTQSVYSIAEDKDGKIWVGTDAGIRVFYNPTNIFSGSNYDGQPIKIVQDGNVELLLDKETVVSIVVDGANNKWVGTFEGGLYCFSPDGITQLYHFTKENSPLYSNTIIDINYDKVTGDIYIGTDLGLQSFRSIIVEGSDKYENVFAYPNPVKANYPGTVFVKGLIDNSVVKIVDQSGNLVWEVKSQGGQIEWPVKTLSGTRVSTGVYIVYATTTNGEQRAVSKILVVN